GRTPSPTPRPEVRALSSLLPGRNPPYPGERGAGSSNRTKATRNSGGGSWTLGQGRKNPRWGGERIGGAEAAPLSVERATKNPRWGGERIGGVSAAAANSVLPQGGRTVRHRRPRRRGPTP